MIKVQRNPTVCHDVCSTTNLQMSALRVILGIFLLIISRTKSDKFELTRTKA